MARLDRERRLRCAGSSTPRSRNSLRRSAWQRRALLRWTMRTPPIRRKIERDHTRLGCASLSWRFTTKRSMISSFRPARISRSSTTQRATVWSTRRGLTRHRSTRHRWQYNPAADRSPPPTVTMPPLPVLISPRSRPRVIGARRTAGSGARYAVSRRGSTVARGY